MKNNLTINVVSGKGGTGKTLLTAVLAEMLGNDGFNVLVVDMDIFVRGLTALLYFHKKQQIHLSKEEELTVAEFFICHGDLGLSGKSRFSISRYRSFDIIPSVSRVDELLEFKDLMPDTKISAMTMVDKLLKIISSNYDIILLDSRAGYDELIAATHTLSTLSLCVEEEDDISKVTSDNLIQQLKSDDSDIPIFRVTNKARNIQDESEVTEKGVTSLGRIPFDMDVMKNFGSKYFWEKINNTLYKSSLAIVWNNLSGKMNLKKNVDTERMSSIGSDNIEERLQLFISSDRVILIYGIIIGVLGVSYSYLGGKEIDSILSNIDTNRLLALVTGIVGFSMSLYTIFKRKK